MVAMAGLGSEETMMEVEVVDNMLEEEEGLQKVTQSVLRCLEKLMQANAVPGLKEVSYSVMMKTISPKLVSSQLVMQKPSIACYIDSELTSPC
jgi:hypothetical protein